VNIVDEFRILQTETVEDNIHRILKGQILNIIGHCTQEQGDKHKSVHEIRKSFKRIRAVLRLIRDEIGYSTYYRENVFYRDLSRRLSEIRNFSVLIDSTRTLQADLSNTIPGSAFEPLIQNLLSIRDRRMEKLVIQEDIMKDIPKQLDTAKARIRDLTVVHDDFRAFKKGLIRIYRQGRKYVDLCRRQPTSRNLHDLRKRIKYLWYHILILQPINPSMLETQAETLDNIGENLGIYHDMEVLRQYLDLHPGILEQNIHMTLMESCEFKKTSILRRSWNSIETLYSEKSKDMAKRHIQSWSIFRNEMSNIIRSS
jgi:CHAD domain-containing protein